MTCSSETLCPTIEAMICDLTDQADWLIYGDSYVFNKDSIQAAEVKGVPCVLIKGVVRAFGLDWKEQKSRLRKEVSRWKTCKTTVSTEEGQPKRVLCLPLSKLPMWIYQLDPNEVSPKLKDELIAFQTECDKVLPKPTDILNDLMGSVLGQNLPVVRSNQTH